MAVLAFCVRMVPLLLLTLAAVMDNAPMCYPSCIGVAVRALARAWPLYLLVSWRLGRLLGNQDRDASVGPLARDVVANFSLFA